MSLIKTTEEIKNYLQTDANFDPASILPFIPAATKDVIRILGRDQYDELFANYDTQSGIPELDDLLPYVQRPIVYFAFLIGLDILNVLFSLYFFIVISILSSSDKHSEVTFNWTV